MDSSLSEPTILDGDGAPETVYLTRSPSQTTPTGWLATSLDVGSWRPLVSGDRLVALDRDSHDEFLVQVAEVTSTGQEVYYRLDHLADLDADVYPELDATRPWLRQEPAG